MNERLNPEVNVSVDNQNKTISIKFNRDGLNYFSDTAAKRSKSVEEAIIEGIRCEQLLADGVLYIRQDGKIRQLIGV